jgi:hypothetical protein
MSAKMKLALVDRVFETLRGAAGTNVERSMTRSVCVLLATVAVFMTEACLSPLRRFAIMAIPRQPLWGS